MAFPARMNLNRRIPPHVVEAAMNSAVNAEPRARHLDSTFLYHYTKYALRAALLALVKG